MTRLTKNKTRSIITGNLIGLLVFVMAFFVMTGEPHAEDRVIRVGYSSTETVEVDESGNYSGYIVEYLENIAQHTGWEYEFIKGTWDENSQKLTTGGIDLMGMIRYTEEREEDMLFSEFSIAEDYTALWTAKDNDIYYADHEAFEGKSVAVIKGTIHEDAFKKHAQKQGFTCEIVYYKTEEDAKTAIKNGEVEMMASGGLANHEDLKIVEQFALERTYFVTGKENQALMEELDKAIEEIKIQNPEFMGELIEEYYGMGDMVTSLRITKEEQEYIDSADPIVIKGFNNRNPFAYEEAGEYTGLIADYMRLISQCTGLEFKLEFTDDLFLGQHASAMKMNGYGLVHTEYPSHSTAERYRLVVTRPMFENRLSTIQLKTQEGQEAEGKTKIALTVEMDYLEKNISSENENTEIEYYYTPIECLEAVMSGDADMTIQNEYTAAHYMQKPKYADALVRNDIESEEGLCLYFSDEDEMLAEIISKAIDYLEGSERAAAMSTSMMKHAYEPDIEDFMYRYGKWVIIVILLISVAAAMGYLLIHRARKFRKQEREKKELEEKLQKDELTGVYSRPYFFTKTEEMLREYDEEIYIIRMNVSRFKIFNELYGSEKGDRLLKEIGEILKEQVINKGFAAGRFSGDHFYCCVPKSEFDTVQFNKKLELDWVDMEVRLTYGVYPAGDSRDIPVSTMCDRADMANKESEKGAGHVCFYSDEERQRLMRTQEIESDMEQALEERQFCIYIQPKYRVNTGKIVGGEALVRWIHPKKGMISPGEFIGVFERNGFIKKLDYYVWEEACRFLAETRAEGKPLQPLSVNVSKVHFYTDELENKLKELIEKYDLKYDELELEITESVYAEDADMITRRCKKLRQMGFKIAMDDFGSGYSSLNMLKEMPLDIIKMDLRFLSGGKDDEQIQKGKSILQTLIKMSHALDLKVVVEGVEIKDQTDFIREIGDCAAQGYYYSRPVETKVYEELLQQEAKDI